jgi:hypothetical protein
MAEPKPRYKYVFLDRGSGVIVLRHIEFANDELAIAHARSLRLSFGEHALEVWEGERFVCRLDAQGMKLGS